MVIIKDYVLLLEILIALFICSSLLAAFFFYQGKKTRASLELLDNVIAMMPGHVYWMDKNSVCLGCNNIQAISAGLKSRKEIVGKRNKDLPWNAHTKNLPQELDSINQKVMEIGQAIMLEEPALRDDGTAASFLSTKSPLRNKKNEIIGVVGISIDITEKKKAEAELHKMQTRLEGVTLLAASIAHELRTPFANLNITTQTIEKKISSLDNDAQHITTDLNSIKKEIKAALTFIDMLLLNINPVINEAKIIDFSIKECINHSLERYPFIGKQQELIQWNPDKNPDFTVHSEELLVIHLFFNLIKNALYYIAKARKGNIEIWIENHTVYFKDTGTGIKPEHLPHIFKHFFSQTYHGAGVGLTFCQWVMDNLNGKITCESEEGHYTLFKLEFP